MSMEKKKCILCVLEPKSKKEDGRTLSDRRTKLSEGEEASSE